VSESVNRETRRLLTSGREAASLYGTRERPRRARRRGVRTSPGRSPTRPGALAALAELSRGADGGSPPCTSTKVHGGEVHGKGGGARDPSGSVCAQIDRVPPSATSSRRRVRLATGRSCAGGEGRRYAHRHGPHAGRSGRDAAASPVARVAPPRARRHASMRGRLYRPLLGVTRADVRRFLADRGLQVLGRSHERRLRTRAIARPPTARAVPRSGVQSAPRSGARVAPRRLRDEDALLAETAAPWASWSWASPGGGRRAQAAPSRRIVRAWLETTAGRTVTASQRMLVLAVDGARRARRSRDPRGWSAGRVARPSRGPPGRSGSRVRLHHPSRVTVYAPGGWQLGLSLPARAASARSATDARMRFDAEALPRNSPSAPRAWGPGAATHERHPEAQDVLVRRKVPREARSNVPLLLAGDGILWVAGLAQGQGAVCCRGPRVVEATLVRSP
jgi:hypothetical protein